jgi:hypothetical protein
MDARAWARAGGPGGGCVRSQGALLTAGVFLGSLLFHVGKLNLGFAVLKINGSNEIFDDLKSLALSFAA